MPRTFKQNEEIKDLRKKEILEKSLILFANEGIETVTMDKIAKAAKCSRSLLYHYYANKEELLNEHKKICEKLFSNKLLEFSETYEDTIDLLIAINNYFLEIIYDSNDIINTYYLYLYVSIILTILNDDPNKVFRNKKFKMLFKRISAQLDKAYPYVSKIEQKSKFVFYLMSISGLAINKIRYPKLFMIKLDADRLIMTYLK